MAQSRKITVPEIIASAADSPAAALAALRKHLKSGIGERYESRTSYMRVIMDRSSKNIENIAGARDTQWRIINHAILLLVAVTGAVYLTHSLIPGIIYRIALGAAGLKGLPEFGHRRGMQRVNHDEVVTEQSVNEGSARLLHRDGHRAAPEPFPELGHPGTNHFGLLF